MIGRFLFLTFLIFMLLQVSCSRSLYKKENTDIISNNNSSVKDTNSFDFLIEQLSNNIEKIWGTNEVIIVGLKNYVKYTDSYKTRSLINFEKGTITVETIAKTGNWPVNRLRKAIIKTLLMSDLKIDVVSKKPFFYGQVIDNFGYPIRWKWRAARFADYLIKTSIKSRSTGINIIYSVTINLVPNHIDKRAHKYMSIIHKAARKYGIEESLILAIIKTESSFNPYAVSSSEALGLMQVVQQSAGKDVFKANGRTGIPSRHYLFDPDKNIDIGTAYLAMLNNIYLNGINNPTSRLYAVISAYNCGAGSVLRVFSNDKVQATNIINSMTPRDVYDTLTTRHPSAESRSYLYKVNIANNNYRNFN